MAAAQGKVGKQFLDAVEDALIHGDHKRLQRSTTQLSAALGMINLNGKVKKFFFTAKMVANICLQRELVLALTQRSQLRATIEEPEDEKGRYILVWTLIQEGGVNLPPEDSFLAELWSTNFIQESHSLAGAK